MKYIARQILVWLSLSLFVATVAALFGHPWLRWFYLSSIFLAIVFAIWIYWIKQGGGFAKPPEPRQPHKPVSKNDIH